MGLWEGMEMLLGYKINAFKVFKGSNLLNQVGNSFIHVGLDSADGAFASFIDPVMQMIYSPSPENEEAIMQLINYDSEGNKINDKTYDELSFTEKYDVLFKYNGGWNNVATKGISAGILSLLSEIPDIYKVIHPPQEKAPTTKDLERIASKNLKKSKNILKENTIEVKTDSSNSRLVYDDVTGEIRRMEIDSSTRPSVELETAVSGDDVGSMLRNTDASSKSIVDTKFKIDNYDENVQISKDRISGEVGPEMVRLYEEGRKTGEDIRGLFGYEEHNFCHVVRVADETESFVKLLNENIEYFDGCQKLNPTIAKISGIAHDLGMKKGGYILLDTGEFVKISEVIENFEKYSSKTYSNGKALNKITLEMLETQLVRSQHASNSAIIVLQNREIFGEYADIVAILVDSHSKSTSGISDVMSTKQLSNMIKNLYNGQAECNYEFNISSILECDLDGTPLENSAGEYIFKQDVLEEIRTGIISLRVGDAHAAKTGHNHAGQAILIEALDNLDKTFYSEYNISEYNIYDLSRMEAEKSVITVGGEELIKDTGFGFEISKQVILGERNITPPNKYTTSVIDGVLTYKFKVNSEAAPACTWNYGIYEKIGEYKTFSKFKQKIVVELPKDIPKPIRKFYIDRSQNIEYDWLKIEIK